MKFKTEQKETPSVREEYLKIMHDRITLIKQSIIALEDSLAYLETDATEESD